MLKPLAFAALCLMLFAADAAFAQAAAQSSGRVPKPNVRVRVGPEVPVRGPAAASGLAATNLFQGVRPGLGLSQQTYRQEDGSAIVRNGLVGSVAVSSGVSAGLGLFSVTHDDQREPEFRRGWSAKDVGPRNRKVAAVGLNLRF